MPLASLFQNPSIPQSEPEQTELTPEGILECQVLKNPKEPIVVKAEKRDSQGDEGSPHRSLESYRPPMRKSPKTLNPRVKHQSPIRKTELTIKDSPSDYQEDGEPEIEEGLILTEIESVEVVKWTRGLFTEVTIHDKFGEINQSIPRIDSRQEGFRKHSDSGRVTRQAALVFVTMKTIKDLLYSSC